MDVKKKLCVSSKDIGESIVWNDDDLSTTKVRHGSPDLCRCHGVLPELSTVPGP